ncbi:MAG: DUF475 domain-containing protein [Rectinemataceae bacterium]|jgi:hypothetical protein
MPILTIIMTVAGLCLFETISSIDNAIINAEVLSGMGAKSRRWFLTWGILIAVFAVRGLLPWLIVWGAAPELGLIGAFLAAFSSDPMVHSAIESAKPVLLMAGGVFLLLLFLHWLFQEPKAFGLPGERFFLRQGLWFYAAASLLICALVWLAGDAGPAGGGASRGILAFAVTIGSTVFFITSGFKQNAEKQEASLLGSTLSDISKLLYLEIIDLTFSIDGVLGAFAFTLSVPIILVGNGLGAMVVRKITVGNIERIKKYRFLKNGAMYSILALGTVMTCEAFGLHLPEWLSPLATFLIVGFFLGKSAMEAKRAGDDPLS